MSTHGELGGFLHTALCHRSADEVLARLVPFVEEGFRTNEKVFVNLSSARTAWLEKALGVDAHRVGWSDTHSWYPHPARRLRAIQELVDDVMSEGRGRLRFVGECAFPEGPPDLVAEWERFDAVLNHALTDAPVSMVCTYDVQALAPDVVARAVSSHPYVGLAPHVANADYLTPAEYLGRSRGAPVAVPGGATRLSGRPTPQEVRSLVQRVLGGVGTRCHGADDVAVAATEIVTNAWQAGAQHIDVACWHEAGEAGLQVDDDGPGLDDPLAGYRRPEPADERGRGLWIARQLADALDIWHHDHGTSVRLRVFDAVAVQGGT